MRYSRSSNPFPFPETFTCGDAYINWPEGKDLVLSGSFDTEVAIPESWVAYGNREEGRTNTTKETYSLIMLTKRMISCEKTKFVPVYRNKQFESIADNSEPPKYSLEYLGAPSSHIESHPCHVPYHLLSFRRPAHSEDPVHKPERFEGNDWLFQLYEHDTDREYEMTPREPLAQSPVINVCDGAGRYTKLNIGEGADRKCNFPKYVEKEPLSCVPSGQRLEGPDGLIHANTSPPNEWSMRFVGAFVLMALAIYYLPWYRRRWRQFRSQSAVLS